MSRSSLAEVQKSAQAMFVISIWVCSFRKDPAIFFLHAGWNCIQLGRWTKIYLMLSSLFQ